VGAEGIAWARAHRPDCILLCVELSPISGYAICNKLKKDAALCDLPLILASIEATPETFEEHRRLKTRADAYLFKPYAVDDVLTAMTQAQHAAESHTGHGGAGAWTPAVPVADKDAEGEGDVAQALDDAPQPHAPQPHAPNEGELPSDADHDQAHDPLMSTDAMLLLEGSVDVSQHTQVLRMPFELQRPGAEALIGEAIADLEAGAPKDPEARPEAQANEEAPASHDAPVVAPNPQHSVDEVFSALQAHAQDQAEQIRALTLAYQELEQRVEALTQVLAQCSRALRSLA
jgi:CheY-like chemotaxis protein